MSRFADAAPDPKSHIKTLMRIGYTMSSAVSDILDNSITANSKNIKIYSLLGLKEINLSIVDDGDGMTPAIDSPFQSPNVPRTPVEQQLQNKFENEGMKGRNRANILSGDDIKMKGINQSLENTITPKDSQDMQFEFRAYLNNTEASREMAIMPK